MAALQHCWRAKLEFLQSICASKRQAQITMVAGGAIGRAVQNLVQQIAHCARMI